MLYIQYTYNHARPSATALTLFSNASIIFSATLGAAAALNGKLYVVGGVGTGSGLIDAVAVYDPKTNTWSEGAAIPTARALLALAAYDGRLWAIGGRGADKRPLASVEIYRP